MSYFTIVNLVCRLFSVDQEIDALYQEFRTSYQEFGAPYQEFQAGYQEIASCFQGIGHLNGNYLFISFLLNSIK